MKNIKLCFFLEEREDGQNTYICVFGYKGNIYLRNAISKHIPYSRTIDAVVMQRIYIHMFVATAYELAEQKLFPSAFDL